MKIAVAIVDSNIQKFVHNERGIVCNFIIRNRFEENTIELKLYLVLLPINIRHSDTEILCFVTDWT